MTKADLLASLGRPMTYYPSLGHATGLKAAVFACQLLFWTDRARLKDWVYKSAEEFTAETALSYEEQRGARAALKRAGLLEERYARLEHRLYYRLNLDRLAEVIISGRDTSGESRSPSGQTLDGELGKPKVADKGNPRSVLPETTSETTSTESSEASPLAEPLRETLGTYRDLFKAKFGQQPIITAKDGKLTKGILAQYGPEVTQRLLRAFFTSRDDWITKSAYTVGAFAVSVNKLLTEMAPVKPTTYGGKFG